MIDTKKRLFDTLHVRASGWGGDPYGTLHVDIEKSKVYLYYADYRDLAYFSDLPSYADPLLTRGILLDEQSFDTRRHIGSYSLELLPGNWFIPYVAYDRDANAGTGVMAFTQNSNEYAVPTTVSDLTNLYRGGIHFELRRFHATVEEGGTTFSERAEPVSKSGRDQPRQPEHSRFRADTGSDEVWVRPMASRDRARTRRLCSAPMRFPGWTSMGNSCSASPVRTSTIRRTRPAISICRRRSCFTRVSSI